MAVTIKDIAKRVGVDPSTVSRVINSTATISEKTKEKIEMAMKEMNYHPNSQARNLVSGSTFTIGLVIDAGDGDVFMNTFFIRSVCAMETVTQAKGYNLLITNDRSESNQNAVKNLILEKKVDGVILPVSSITEELVELLRSNHFPFVVLGEPAGDKEGMHWVDNDNAEGGRLAVRHLLQQGYCNPVLFVENKGTVFEKNRILGVQQGLEEAGIPWRKEMAVEGQENREQIGSCLSKQLEDSMPIDAVICTNNVVACYVLAELKKLGRRVPEDVGVITFDNFPLAEYMEPQLSVIDIDTYRLGEMAALALFERIREQKEEVGQTIIPTQIIERNSTKRKGEEGLD